MRRVRFALLVAAAVICAPLAAALGLAAIAIAFVLVLAPFAIAVGACIAVGVYVAHALLSLLGML